MHLNHQLNLKGNENFIKDIQIDPDNVMTDNWKQKFTLLCENFSDIIQYKPATYNGFYGFVHISSQIDK